MTTEEWLSIGAGVAGLLVVGAAATYGLVVYRRYRARRALIERFAAVSRDRLQDVLLPDGSGGWFHVDFLLLTARRSPTRSGRCMTASRSSSSWPARACRCRVGSCSLIAATSPRAIRRW